MNAKSVKRVGVVLGAAALGVGVLGAPAQADPTGFRPVVAVGSDTTQEVMNGISAAGSLIGSYDATGSATIDTRSAAGVCDSVARPNGSSAGISALVADIAAGTNCIDAARSSRGPKDTSTNDLSWVKLAKDAVTVAVRTDSGLINHSFTKAQLQSIYQCSTTVINVPGVGNITLNPLLPQAGSGTRAYWATEMGINDVTPPSCVKDTNGGQPVQEHDGRALLNQGDLMPMSIAAYIAQVNGVSPDRLGAADVRPIGGVAPYTAEFKLNTAFPIVRDVYNVVKTTRLGETDIAAAFVGTGSEACNDTVIETYGFGLLADCGSVAFTGKN
ncbi:hypothetical protein ABZ611_16160 [Streptomyces sp. NPDC007861]|uniref:substrate-binding domain-containing protein n=1 Tax=Streptomyces sp. NPDC007861 TaxID=3154893 RepID=UPI0033E762EA